MDNFPLYLRQLERVMEWWTSTVPTWMQPKWFWDFYYYLID